MLHEYLLSYGSAGDFGRFHPVQPLTCRRGDRAVVRSHRGTELGVVLCDATPGHARHLPNTSMGQLLRLASAEDEHQAEQMRQLGQRVFEAARRLAGELNLPLEIMDVEVLLDARHAIVHHLRWNDYDARPFVSTLAHGHDLTITLHDLKLPEPVAEDEEHGCGRPDCGQKEGGGCTSCGSGGGCSSCGASAPKDMKAVFSGLREKMMGQERRPLL